MSKIGVWDLNSAFQHPFSPCNVNQNDVCIDFLFRKLCPVHSTPLVLCKEIKLTDDYTRVRYGCLSCRCFADFVGDELKSDSVAQTLEYIHLMIKDLREVEAANIDPTSSGGIRV